MLLSVSNQVFSSTGRIISVSMATVPCPEYVRRRTDQPVLQCSFCGKMIVLPKSWSSVKTKVSQKPLFHAPSTQHRLWPRLQQWTHAGTLLEFTALSSVLDEETANSASLW